MQTGRASSGVRVARLDDAPALTHVLAAAFADDPVMGWLIPDPRRRRTRLGHFFALELEHLAFSRGEVWTSADRSGAALAMPPGRWRMPTRTQLVHVAGFARAFGRRLALALALQTRMERRHLREPHVYIPYVGVAPEGQGRGLGTRLMRPVLDRCDETGLPAYLEATSERNAALYERLGFRFEGELRMAGSPPLWPMRRPPTAA